MTSSEESFTTERLLGRRPAAGDGAVVHQAVEESRQELARWLEWAQNPSSPETHETRAIASAAAFQSGEQYIFNVFLKTTGEFICRVSLTPADAALRDQTGYGDWWEVGYWCRTKCAGQGYVTEALEGAIRWAMGRGIAWFAIRVAPENNASRRVAEKLAFMPLAEMGRSSEGEPRVLYQRRMMR